MLTTVRLPNNNIPDEGVEALVSCIAERPMITELNISGNRIGAAGCKALVQLLSTRWMIIASPHFILHGSMSLPLPGTLLIYIPPIFHDTTSAGAMPSGFLAPATCT